MEQRVITIKDVARRVGVSVSTVSRVLNHSAAVSPETEQLVMQAVRDLRFKPSQIAKGFASRKTSTIGLIIPDVANPFFADVARGTEDAAMAAGYATILCNSDWKSDREFMYLHLLHDRWIDGVIVVGSRADPEHLLNAIGAIPYVVVERLMQRTGNTVWTDNHKGGMLATQHLLDIGCRSFAPISGPPDSPSATERRRGFIETMQRANIASYEVYEGDYRFQSGFEIGQQIFSSRNIPEGIFVANDLMAIGVLRAASQSGVRIPEQTAVAGYDNISAAD